MSFQIPTRALAALALCAAAPAHATDPITARSFETLDRSETPQGVAFAPRLGDRFAAACMAMARLPAGTVSPAHVKSANMFGTMLQGTMTDVAATADPAAPAPLPEGAFYVVPAGLAHVSSCLSDSACVTFLSQDGTFEFLPVGQ